MMSCKLARFILHGRQNMFNLFNRKPVVRKHEVPEDSSGDDIPRYPPFAKGLPAAHTSRIIHSQEELITRIQGALRFSQGEFESIVLPVIERYAAYVHLLPASESHHHRGAGGLFRHGLEVGFWAAQRAESYQFCVGDTPINRRENEPRWQLASFLGGLLHDVGKPLSDVAVTDKSGIKEWNPYESSLFEWFRREGVTHYFLRWRDKRNKRHEKFSMMNLDQIITPKAKSYLNKPGPNIMEALLESIVGTSASEAITQIVMWADQESVRRDLVNQRLDVDEYAYGVPVERFIFDALRRLVNTSKINQPGSLIWRLEQGVFIAWNQIVPKIHQLIEEDKIPGVPRSADTLADILIERGFAIPYQESTEVKPYRYWRIYPESLQGVALLCLRIDDLELIYTNEPPPPTKASFNAPKKQHDENPKADDADLIDAQEDDDEAEKKSVIDREKEFYTWDEVETASNEKEVNDKSNHDANNQSSLKSNMISKVTETSSQEEEESENRNVTNKINIEPNYNSNFKPKNTDNNSEGWSLIKKGMNEKSKIEDIFIKLNNGDIGIPYPESAKLLGEPREVMNLLHKDGLLRNDQASTSKTSTISGKKYLVLSRETSQILTKEMSVIFSSGEPNPSKDINNTNDSNGKLKNPNKNERSPEVNRKLPSQEDFGKALIQQITEGFGPFISGDIQIDSTNESEIYKVEIESIQSIASYLGTTPTAIRTMIRKVPSVNLKINHESGDYIEYVEETAS